MSDDLIAVVIVLAIMLLVAFPIHEFSHALAAYRLGDGTAKLFGRLTLNPIVHFDPIGGTLLAASMLLSSGFACGWANPTPVNPLNLRGGRQGEAIVAIAGPASNLVLASLGGLAFRLFDMASIPGTGMVLLVAYYFVVVNVALMLFNLIPIPPLDGSRVLFALMSPATAWRWRPILEQYGTLILLLAVFLPILPGGQTIVGAVFVAVAGPLIDLLLGL